MIGKDVVVLGFHLHGVCRGYDIFFALFFHHGEQGGIVLKGTEAGDVAILHLADVHADDALALWTHHAHGQRVAGQEDVGDYGSRVQTQPAPALGE